MFDGHRTSVSLWPLVFLAIHYFQEVSVLLELRARKNYAFL